MTSKCEILEGNIAKIDMTIDAKEAESAYNKAFKKISQKRSTKNQKHSPKNNSSGY